MVSAICKAKNPATCPYHGAVLTLHKIEAEMASKVKETGSLPGDLLEKYIQVRNNILNQEKEGWTESDYQRNISAPVVQEEPLQDFSSFLLTNITPTSAISPSAALAEKLRNNNMTVGELSQKTGLTVDEVKNILAVKIPVTPKIAYQLSKAFGTETEWLRLQREYSHEMVKARGTGAYYPGDPGYIPGNKSEELQTGAVVGMMIVADPKYNGEETVFHRRTNEVTPNEPYQIRIQANRRLNGEDVKRMASLLGYSYSTTVRGENLDMPYQDTPFSFVVSADTTKSRRDDLGQALYDLEKVYPKMLVEGTPQRKTQNFTRAIDGFNDDSLEVEFYYDSVYLT